MQPVLPVLITPSPNNPDRWYYLVAGVLLAGLIAYVLWPKPSEPTYSNGTPVVLTARGKRALEQAFKQHRDSATYYAHRADSQQALINQEVKNHALVLKNRHDQLRSPSRRLPARADSVRTLADSLYRALTKQPGKQSGTAR